MARPAEELLWRNHRLFVRKSGKALLSYRPNCWLEESGPTLVLRNGFVSKIRYYNLSQVRWDRKATLGQGAKVSSCFEKWGQPQRIETKGKATILYYTDRSNRSWARLVFAPLLDSVTIGLIDGREAGRMASLAWVAWKKGPSFARQILWDIPGIKTAVHTPWPTIHRSSRTPRRPGAG